MEKGEITIVKRVEELRKQLNNLAKQKGGIDTEVVDLSQRLDELINLYYNPPENIQWAQRRKS